MKAYYSDKSNLPSTPDYSSSKTQQATNGSVKEWNTLFNPLTQTMTAR